MDYKKLKRILIVNPFGIGDVLFSMVLVEALRAALPQAVIGFLCNERTVDLVRMNPSVDRHHVFNRDAFRGFWRQGLFSFLRELGRFLGEIRGVRYDTLVDLSLGREYSFFGACVGIPRRVGFDFKRRGLFLTRKIKIEGYEGEPVVRTQLRLLDLLGVPQSNGALRVPLQVSFKAHQVAADTLGENGFAKGDKILAVAPGGGRSWGKDAIYKQWDPERFAQAADEWASSFGGFIVLLGDRDEEPLLRKTASLLKARHLIFAGEPLERVSALLLRAHILLCNDGGILHLASALGVRTVSIFGPVDEKVYGPFRPQAQAKVLTQEVPCRPCYQRFYFPPCPFERRCLTELEVEKVVSALGEIP